MQQKLLNPSSRDIIVLIDDEIDRELRYNKDLKFIIPENKGVVVINLDHLDEIESKIPELARAIKIKGKSGDILVRIPFEELEYSKLEDSIYEIPQLKIDYVMTFCGLLGAKKATFLELTNTTTKQSVNFDVNMRYDVISTSASINDRFMSRLSRELSYQREWKGIPNLKEAENYLWKKGLRNDTTCYSLFEEVKNNPGNLKRYRKELRLSSELNNRLNLLVKCEIPVIFNIDANYKNSYSRIDDYSLIFEVEF